MRQLVGLFVTAMVIFASCEFTYKIKSGEEAYEVKQYAVAVDMLGSEYSELPPGPDRAEKAYLTGLSYEQMNNAARAADWFANAIEDNYGPEAYVKYAENLTILEEYDNAIAAYEQLGALTGNRTAYRAEITACKQAQQWKESADNSEYNVQVMSFNSAGADYSPYVMGPDIVLFTSDRSTEKGAVYNWTGRGFSDIYIANLGTNTVESFDDVINTPDNEGTVAMTSDREMIYFSRCFDLGDYDMHCKIMASYRQGQEWSEAEVLPFVKENINYGHPALYSNDSLMIFSCNDPEGFGGYDLYFSRLTDEGWSSPANLSSRLNTPGDEKFPTLYADTLFFSSDYHVGMGGLDIFKSYLTTSGEWTPPLNLKPPVNSGADDFGLVVDTFSRLHGNVIEKGYFSSARGDVEGTDDVYSYSRVITTPSEPEVIADVTEEEEQIDYKLFLSIRVMEPVFDDPNDPNSARNGKRPLVNARVNLSEGMMGKQLRTNEDGYVILAASYESRYGIEARFTGFLTKRTSFDATTVPKDPEKPTKTHSIEIVLEPIFKGKEIVLENIYYDLDKWDIRPDAEPPLNELASILRDNPRIRIELGSHTDCRAEDDYNLELSQKRAQSAVDYLVSNGIAAERMVAKGYGETQLAVNCVCESCTEDEHQQNRRTTFKIVN